ACAMAPPALPAPSTSVRPLGGAGRCAPRVCSGWARCTATRYRCSRKAWGSCRGAGAVVVMALVSPPRIIQSAGGAQAAAPLSVHRDPGVLDQLGKALGVLADRARHLLGRVADGVGADIVHLPAELGRLDD